MAAVSGLPPAGPERRERQPLRLPRTPGASLTGPLCATDMGFTLHAATVARRDDVAGREALARYALRPPLAEERVAVLADGRVSVTLKRAFSDGTTAVEMDPLSLLCRLAASGAKAGRAERTAAKVATCDEDEALAPGKNAKFRKRQIQRR